ncbi:AAA domain-containing protein [Sphingobacterium sp. SGL-16]|uniref:AAA domain-containing protein n=1 Tax=Sphingobacterium sp. SGL-16 TaxID=2710883 RepID=UPI0013ECC3BF|nr:AAA domain-containing protein [Sphingobacterium sp. SGL-16]NGM72235.1 AAA family ATPase [Sphingobacterium sp. SGL-16]
MNYFDEQIALLEAEKQIDFIQHENLLLRSSLQERRTQGVSWFPISISGSEIGRGDYLTITIQKTNFLEEGHRFRFGMPVALFSNHDPETDRLEGIIAFVSRDTMRISVRVDELPDWTRRGKLGVDLLFDEHSYKEMFDALKEAKQRLADPKEVNLVQQLLGEKDYPYDSTEENIYHNELLNKSQNDAVGEMLSNKPLVLMHGPPGTGKTTTLIAGIQALLKARKKQILVIAPSNTAVDLLTERLHEKGINVIRMGNPVRVSDHLQKLTLDAKIDSHNANKERKNLEKQVSAYLDMAHKYKRNFGKAERDQRKALFDEARKIRREIDKIQDYIVEDVLNNVEVITATLVGSNHTNIKQRDYETVIIDEAGQSLEAACWIPILKADRLIMAGDHCQLPPTVKSSIKPNEGLYLTLFEKLVKRFPVAVSLLDVQYRMNSQIMLYPSQVLYEGKLIADSKVAHWALVNDSKPFVFIDTAGAGFEELVEENAISNKEEALFLIKHLKENLTNLSKEYAEDNFPRIGIIAPYRLQSHILKEMIYADEFFNPFLPFLQIHTIDSFQGQEKDVIYISLTRSNSLQQIGFLSDIRRMNVAMTRAKKKLIVIGDSGTVGQHSFYKGMLDYVTELNNYHSVWEWME